MLCSSPTLTPYTWEPCHMLWANWVWTALSMPQFLSIRWVRCSCMIFIRWEGAVWNVMHVKLFIIKLNCMTTIVFLIISFLLLSLETTVRISHSSPWMMWTLLLIKFSNWNTLRLSTWKVGYVQIPTGQELPQFILFVNELYIFLFTWQGKDTASPSRRFQLVTWLEGPFGKLWRTEKRRLFMLWTSIIRERCEHRYKHAYEVDFWFQFGC